MFVRLDSRLTFAALFAAASLLAGCARKEAKKLGDTAPETDGGDQTPPPDPDGDDDSPGQPDEPGDKSVKEANTKPGQEPEPEPKPKPKQEPTPVDPTVESIQANLLNVACIRCHQGQRPRAGLDLTNLKGRLDGTVHDAYRGRLVVAGEPDSSMLLLVIDPAVSHSQDLPVMPPTASGIPAVTAAQAQAVRTFIRELPADGDGRGDSLDPSIEL